MSLSKNFDAVLMLTWSDWKTEPRSNRYHYAIRLAKTLPVLFLQHEYVERPDIEIEIEPSGSENIDIVRISCPITRNEIQQLKNLLSARGIRRPLLWIYDSVHYQPLIDALPRAFRVYHATEDYLTHSNGWNLDTERLAASVKNILRQTDFMVACAEGVAKSYLTIGGYRGPYAVIENGCDAEFFIALNQHARSPAMGEKPVAIFQGGINKRLDYDLLLQLVQRMPDWEFQFCGAVHGTEGWSRLLEEGNVKYLGALQPEQFGRAMHDATVGLIPFIQDQWIRNSYPLKAYEYVACGLPVVSVPITSLENQPALFHFGTTAQEFETAIRTTAASRSDAAMIAQRVNTALGNSYNERFARMEQQLLPALEAARQAPKRLRIAMLYDGMHSMHVNTIAEHLQAFDKYSRHEIVYITATPAFWQQSPESVEACVELSAFDAVMVHYSTRLSIREHLDEGLARSLEKYAGLKVLFIQDEYESTEIARSWMDRLKFDIVYTCVPAEYVDAVYPAYRFPATEFLPTLTGYVPEQPGLELFGRPLSERKLAIAYRGRALDPIYGELGQEKYRIGVEMKVLATLRGVPVDIEVDDSKRIYGNAWYEFLGSARATLGTESGANVFDYDGSLRKEIARLKEENPKITFREISERVLAGHEGLVRMNQISPKIFEAIRMRTALILFEGDYSGVVRPDEHYIPLKKDFSNIDEVLEKLADDAYLQAMTDRAHRDVVESQRYSYRQFVEGVDHDLETRLLHDRSSMQLLHAVFRIDADGAAIPVLPLMPPGLWSGAHPLGKPTAVRVVPPAPDLISSLLSSHPLQNSLPVRAVRKVWRLLPYRVRKKLHGPARATAIATYQGSTRVARYVWSKLPNRVRLRLGRLMGRYS
ncbi:glycosyltransferase, group 1 family protein [Bordetella bronchiseptica 99-R-0433]|uniref:glycosyltransferase family protein n=1 Tax=Bordetella bronchiseptica TaxID=518 RepID=UPI00045ACC92|nr:glycosyltransferase [Bordetella bronchiseptica]KCV61283.1 glycosyltransferase, group 1 family protein [Bordetella bronchiseptica 99-R-0433]